MPAPSDRASATDRLDSWKEIATYLGREVRTVQGWEKTEGLPIHRHQHARQGSVYAFKSELDAWREVRRSAGDTASRENGMRETAGAVALVAPASPEPGPGFDSLDPPGGAGSPAHLPARAAEAPPVAEARRDSATPAPAVAPPPAPARHRRVPAAAILAMAAMLLAVLASVLWLNGRKPSVEGPSSVVVLPFLDLSPQKDQEYFSDGLTEELIDALTRVPSLRVVARTSAFAFKGKAVDIRQIGQQLNVATVLEGSVRKSGEDLRITAQ